MITRLLHPLEYRRLFAAGDPDLTFGGHGLITDAPGVNVNVRDVALLPDDKILVGGGIAAPTIGDYDYMLRRYNPDGTLDTGFGGGDGTVQGRFRNAATRLVEIRLTSDQKLVALSLDETDPSGLIVARFNSDGSLDSSFSDDGFLVQQIDSGSYSVEVDVDGRIIVIVARNLTRYTSNGTLDMSFGNNGTVENVTGSSVMAVTPLADGSLLVGGGIFVGDDPLALQIVKLNENGALNTGFGANGQVIVDVDGNSRDEGHFVRKILVLPDQRIVAICDFIRGLSVTRFSAAGVLDTSFGTQGSTKVGLDGSVFRGHVDDDGRIYATTAFGGAARFTTDGQLDPAFGRVRIGGPDAIFARSAGISSTGRLIFGGENNRTVPTITLLARNIEDDGVPSAITLVGNSLNIAGTNEDDLIYVQDFKTIDAAVNGFGRVFDLEDINLISITGGDGDDVIRMDDIQFISTHISGGLGRDRITGGDSGDTLLGNGGRDFIDGGLGADLIVGNSGKDQLRGEAGKDRVYGREGDDYVDGGNGDDRLRGDLGHDLLLGGIGDDQFFVNDDIEDFLFGGGGEDIAETDELDIVDSIESIL